MIVFKNYFKVMKKYKYVIIMYTVIFTMFAVMATNFSSDIGSFSSTKPKVAIVNHDADTVLIDSFYDYLDENTKIVKLDEDEDSLKDAVFFSEVEYILIIPKNFTEDFLSGKNPKINTMSYPLGYGNVYTEMLLNRFLNISQVYVQSGMNQEMIANNIKNDLKETATVTLNSKTNFASISSVNYYYNFMNYTLIAICVHIIGMILNSFNMTNIKRRNIVSNYSYKKINRQLFLGNLCLMVGIWLLYVGISFILYLDSMMTYYGLLMIINSFVFCITILSMGFLIGSVIRNRQATDGIVNVLALGSSFLCGAFVPQEFLGDFVVSISKVLPSYWFIKNNNDIAKLSSFDFSSLQPIFINMLIVLIFGILLFIITNIISKLRIKNS
ncbi:MAG: ABC transporter permease [Ignavibacteriales bacterium]